MIAFREGDQIMKKKYLSVLIVGLLIFGFVGIAGATLIDNLDGTVTQIRDDGSKLMWLQDFSLSGTFPGAGTDGTLRYAEAVSWANQLVFAGYDDWRLPSAFNFDGSGPDYGFNVTTSEMGNLYYIELNGTVGPPDGTSHLGTEGPFININFLNHWSSTVYAPSPRSNWGFGFGTGIQADVGWRITRNHTTAVRVVPEPTTILLLGAGLAGLAVLGRKRFKK